MNHKHQRAVGKGYLLRGPWRTPRSSQSAYRIHRQPDELGLHHILPHNVCRSLLSLCLSVCGARLFCKWPHRDANQISYERNTKPRTAKKANHSQGHLVFRRNLVSFGSLPQDGPKLDNCIYHSIRYNYWRFQRRYEKLQDVSDAAVSLAKKE